MRTSTPTPTDLLFILSTLSSNICGIVSLTNHGLCPSSPGQVWEVAIGVGERDARLRNGRGAQSPKHSMGPRGDWHRARGARPTRSTGAPTSPTSWQEMSPQGLGGWSSAGNPPGIHPIYRRRKGPGSGLVGGPSMYDVFMQLWAEHSGRPCRSQMGRRARSWSSSCGRPPTTSCAVAAIRVATTSSS